MATPNLLTSRFVTGPNDELATPDIYELTEGALRNRGSVTSDEALLDLLSNSLRVPQSTLEEVKAPLLNLFKENIDWLQDRVNDLLNKLPFDLAALLSEDGLGRKLLSVDFEDLGFGSLNIIWEYAGRWIGIDPSNKAAYEAALRAINGLRLKNGGDEVSQGIDQGAETIVYGNLIEKIIQGGIGLPVTEIINNLSDDKVKRNVAEKVFPEAIRQGDKKGPDPTNANSGPDMNLGDRVINGPLNEPEETISPRFEQKPRGNEEAFANRDKGQTGGGGFDGGLISDLLQFTTPEQMNTRDPGLIKMILYYYQLPRGDYSLEAEYLGLVDLLSKLQPLWATTERDGTPITKLLPFTCASQDAVHVFTAYPGSRFKAQVMIASRYRSSATIIQQIKRQYPLIAI